MPEGLEVVKINRLPQEFLHLLGPGSYRHVKDLVFELNHQSSKDAGIDLSESQKVKMIRVDRIQSKLESQFNEED